MSENIQRIDKIIANKLPYSRSQVRELIKKKKVIVNDKQITTADYKVNTDTDIIVVDGKTLNYSRFVYYMLHKPAGVVSATNDNTCKTVLELIDKNERKGLFPIGRLDKDTEGLLLITNDGELSHALLSPKKHIEKMYYVETDGKISEEMLSILENGVDIGDDKPTLPAKAKLAQENENALYLTIIEGRFHQVKRMLKAVGRTVLYLKRISMGEVVLDAALEKGAYRLLTEEELLLLKRGNVNAE